MIYREAAMDKHQRLPPVNVCDWVLQECSRAINCLTSHFFHVSESLLHIFSYFNHKKSYIHTENRWIEQRRQIYFLPYLWVIQFICQDRRCGSASAASPDCTSGVTKYLSGFNSLTKSKKDINNKLEVNITCKTTN